MTALGPAYRRYWLCSKDALDALAAAIDPPDWEDGGVATLIFCLDAQALAHCAGLADGDATFIDATDPATFADELASRLAREQAARIQICRHAVLDFAPALELATASDAPMLAGQAADVGPTATALGAGPVPEAMWLSPTLARQALAACPLAKPDAAGLDALLAEATRVAGQVELSPLILGARFVSGESSDEAAIWRARAAATFARIDRLEVERRHQRLREADISLKLTRQHARERKRLAAELDAMRGRLAAPWSAARWRMRRGQLRRSRLGKAFGRWF